MKLTRCDNCGREETGAPEWYELRKTVAPEAIGGFVVGGAHYDLDLCSPKCIEEKVRTFYAPESEGAAPK